MLSDDHTPNRHHTRTSTHHTVRAYTIMPASIELLNSVTGQIGHSKKDTHPPNGVGGEHSPKWLEFLGLISHHYQTSADSSLGHTQYHL